MVQNSTTEKNNQHNSLVWSSYSGS